MVSAFFAMSQDTAVTNEYFRLLRTYNTIDEVYQAHPELIPAPPKIVINDEEVLFYNDSREVVNRMPVVKEAEITKDDSLYEKYHEDFKLLSDYSVFDGTILLVTKYYVNENQSWFKNAKLFDKTGNFLIDIDKDTGVKISPDGQFFATCYEGEAGGGYVQIFDNTGKRICFNNYVSDYTSIEFDKNNNLFINDGQNMILIFENIFCDNLVYYNFFDNLNINAISSAFYSYDFHTLLISSFGCKIYYINSDTKELHWEKFFETVEQCIFKLDENRIFVQSREEYIAGQPFLRYIHVLDSQNGIDLKSIQCENIVVFDKNLIIIKKGGRYYEFEI